MYDRCIVVVIFMLVFSEIGETQNMPLFINCGANANITADSRTWVGDLSSQKLIVSFTGTVASNNTAVGNSVYINLYTYARVFNRTSNYTFELVSGSYFLRLHFCPLSVSSVIASKSVFDVTANNVRLLSQFNVTAEITRKNSYFEVIKSNLTFFLIKEYFLDVRTEELLVTFAPRKGSFAFINAIEVVPVLGAMFDSSVSKVGGKSGSFSFLNKEMEMMYRLNVGEEGIDPRQDLDLWRKWDADSQFMYNIVASSIIYNRSNISYGPAESYLIAPIALYIDGRTMTDPAVIEKRVNMSWKTEVDPGFEYLVRLHFCELFFDKVNQRVFRIYVNNQSASDNFDVLAKAGGKGKTYHKDYVDLVSETTNTLWIQLGPASSAGEPEADAILNGLEIFKISKNSNLAYVSEKFNSSFRRMRSKNYKIILWTTIFSIFALVMSLLTYTFFCCKKKKAPPMKKQPAGWRKLFFHDDTGGPADTHASKIPLRAVGSLATVRVGRRFTIAEIRTATKNFDESLVIGTGGFGKVYKGEIDDETLVAVKRAHPQSEQGLKEFETEIEMLSKLRHRHLVSIIGYCEDNNEMVLVYEYMAHGTLRSHLIGNDHPALSWKQRLDACIGAARGLHYLHTGSERGIIHRDVKTTNILLDENFVAKVADFGLSKTGPSLDKTHVSTAVKGSFGYLDPEYFRKQHLTAKSDVYSFGVVLFEVVCARPVINPSLPKEQINLAEWALRWQQQGSLETIVDPRLNGTYSLDSLNKLGEIAVKCLADEGKNRPTIAEVLWHLEYVLHLHEASTQNRTEGFFARTEAGYSMHLCVSGIEDQCQSLPSDERQGEFATEISSENTSRAGKF